MSTLVVIGYDDMHKAQEMRLNLAKMQGEYLVDLEDAVSLPATQMARSNCIRLSACQPLAL